MKRSRITLKSLKKIKVILWLVAILWMLFIFYLSSQPARISWDLSKKITILFINFIKQVQEINFISPKYINEINTIMRQYAHVVVYIVLAILIFNALTSSRMNVLMNCLIAFVISITFACSDEIHQMFVPGRGVQLQDLLMDCTGVLLGLVIYITSALLYKKLIGKLKRG